MATVQLLPGAVSEIFASATETGILTTSDRYGLMAAMLTENLEQEERCAIDRLFRSIRRGTVNLSDEL